MVMRLLYLYFNSIKVQLERFSYGLNFFIILNFNSIKVQLEPAKPSGGSLNPPFQFHKGTIRTQSSTPNYHLPKKFQFHKGTIRTPLDSTGIGGVLIFQFHKGTIRTKFLKQWLAHV